jgi:lysyl-tRNA synthetase, class II
VAHSRGVAYRARTEPPEGVDLSTPYTFAHDAFAADLHRDHESIAAGEGSGTTVAVAGRVMLMRSQGKLAFATMRDSTGEIQLFATSDKTTEFESFARLHLGDWVGATGEVVRTRRGELSVQVASWETLAVARHNFGEKWSGISDHDIRYRHREADLWANDDARAQLRGRSDVIRSLRERLWGRGFLEVETPMLGTIASGAAARPFVTHHNAFDVDFALRIAPELWLKRLVVGGFERIFEIGRVFRNEGVSTRHNPEFTMIELYIAYFDVYGLMRFTEELVADVARDVRGSDELTYQGRPMSFAPPWTRATMADLTSAAVGVDVSVHSPRDQLVDLVTERGGTVHDAWGPGRLLAELFEATCEDALWHPTFVTEYPLEVSPLSRQLRGDDDLTERFELYAAGRELANGFSELTDPDDQRKRFEDQARQKAAGEAETMDIDEDYIKALEWGLPPTAGLGIGVDRLAMLITDAPTIREIIAFPTLKPRAATDR